MGSGRKVEDFFFSRGAGGGFPLFFHFGGV